MKILTRQDLIDSVYLRWSKQYHGWIGEKIMIGEKLKTAKTKQEIDEIIGNDSWTKLNCSHCRADSETVVELVNDCKSYFAICLPCVNKAKSKIESVK